MAGKLEKNATCSGSKPGESIVVNIFDPITYPDYDTPFPLVDLVFKNRPSLSIATRR